MVDDLLCAEKGLKAEKGELLFTKNIEYQIIGMSNGMMVSGKRKKYWMLKEKHNPEAKPFFVLKSNIDKLSDKKMIINE